MITFRKHILDNGLRVILHHDPSTPMVAVNVAYDVGSRDEDPEKTGMAHLCEHLMFGGSKHIPDFDTPVQMAGGENNAFTNSDITNYYTVLPATNVETALWLESDRMMSLNVSQKTLDTQKKVVVEEFKETSLNEPYGDMWHHLSAMAYSQHTYRWPTIGKIPQHIKDTEIHDVRDFFGKYYSPCNAILVIAGNISEDKALDLAESWFGGIPRGNPHTRNIPHDLPFDRTISKTVTAEVPAQAIILATPMVARNHYEYYAYDLFSDVLSNGRSSRFFQNLHQQHRWFNQIDAYISGTQDPGLFIIEGRPVSTISLDRAKELIYKEIQSVIDTGITERELQKIKNKVLCSLEYAEVNILHKAMSLAYFELLGDADLINQESKKYEATTSEDILSIGKRILNAHHVDLRYVPVLGR